MGGAQHCSFQPFFVLLVYLVDSVLTLSMGHNSDFETNRYRSLCDMAAASCLSSDTRYWGKPFNCLLLTKPTNFQSQDRREGVNRPRFCRRGSG